MLVSKESNGRYLVIEIAIALPVAMLFAQIGIAAYKRLSDEQYRRLLITGMFLSGAVLWVKEIA